MERVAPISVLMSTYRGDRPDLLRRSVDSIRLQTVLPSQVVLVVDGDIPEDLDHIVETCFSQSYLQVAVVVVRLEANSGLAHAMNVGLRECSCPWVARLDSDDIAVPERLERQWEYIQTHGNIDVLCSWHRECSADGTGLGRMKKLPEHHKQIVKRLKWRNIVSHPTVMFRRDTVISVGGYDTHSPLQQDYDLYVRLVIKGARFAACQEPLVDVTADREQRVRRGGITYLVQTELPTRWNMFKCGFISLPFAVVSSILRTAFVLSPSSLKWVLYGFVRSKDRALGEGS